MNLAAKNPRRFSGIQCLSPGTATAGIPHAAWVADQLDPSPWLMSVQRRRPTAMGNQIEGGVRKGQPTVVIEDLISTGGSVVSRNRKPFSLLEPMYRLYVPYLRYNFDTASSRLQGSRCYRSMPLPITPHSSMSPCKEGYIKNEDLQLLARLAVPPLIPGPRS